MAGNDKYINFPVGLLADFLTDTKDTLNNIVEYGVFAAMQEKFAGNEEKTFGFYNITLRKGGLKNGQQLYNQYTERPQPKTGLCIDLFWDYYKNYKSDQEKVCLLAFLGLKSILGGSAYKKADKLFLFSRMSGKNERATSIENIAPELQPYYSRWKFEQIIWELQTSWSLKYYADHTRGFYFSFALELEKLVESVEKNKATYRKKEDKAAYRLAVEAAKRKAGTIPP